MLQILFESRHQGYLSTGQIRRHLPEQYLPLRHPELEYLFRKLKERDLVNENKKTLKLQPVSKSRNSPTIGSNTITEYKYEITDAGIDFVSSGFQRVEPARFSGTPNIFIGNNINFGVINNSINYNVEINRLVGDEDLREEIRSCFDELQNELSRESINKRKVIDILKGIGEKISDKGLDKVMDLAYTIISSFFKFF